MAHRVWRAALPVALVAAVFVFAVVQLATAIDAAGKYQSNVREAQIARARVLRVHLDEETGFRGFLNTQRRVFLEPYYKGLNAQADDFAALDSALAALDLAGRAGRYVADERKLHERWLSGVAKPLLANELRADRSTLEIRGKNITDSFRGDDDSIFRLLIGAGSSADAALHAAFLRSVIFAAVVGLGTLALVSFFYARRVQLEREVARQRELYETEKRIADTLQSAFLQREFPQAGTLEFHAVYLPAAQQAQVGGDWYDAFMLPGGRVMFSLGDVAGHGLDSAVTMSRVRQAIIAGAVRTADPADILANANRALLLQEERMVTAVCGFVDTRTLEISYALAGHPPPILMADDRPEFLQFGGMALGVAVEPHYETYFAHGAEGSVLVLYTDGAVEYGRDIAAGERRLLQAVRDGGHAADPAAAIREGIFAEIAPNDDVAIMTISFRTPAHDEQPAHK